MLQGNLYKYQQNPKLLAEANPIDCTWGIGLAENDPKALNPECWKDRNLLGLCLIEVWSLLV